MTSDLLERLWNSSGQEGGLAFMQETKRSTTRSFFFYRDCLSSPKNLVDQRAMELESLQLRRYQQSIAALAASCNTIVFLPTGAGKTWIAAEAIVQVGTPALFLVPTIPLVQQQAQALRSRPNMQAMKIVEFHDERALPQCFDVLVTTAKAFEGAQARGERSLAWNVFQTVVFGECRHVLKNHPYRDLASKLKGSGCKPRVIGLEASLTDAGGEAKIKKGIQSLCRVLRIERIENATDQELRGDGYRGAGRVAVTEVRLPEMKVRPNILPKCARKPRLEHRTFFWRVKKGTATPFSLELVRTIRCLEKQAQLVDASFTSPLTNTMFEMWGKYAQKRTDIYAQYAQKGTETHRLFEPLVHWYEALRLLVVSWEDDEDIALAFLRMMKCHQEDASCWDLEQSSAIHSFFANKSQSSTRLDSLCHALMERSMPTIVFVELFL
jgi:Type III restriction enzyme, res subunit